MRQFKSQIFMGNGELSTKLCSQLIKKIQKGFSCLSGIQQMCGGHSKEEKEYIAEAEKELIDITEDVAAAFLGRRIKIGNRLPKNQSYSVYIGKDK